MGDATGWPEVSATETGGKVMILASGYVKTVMENGPFIVDLPTQNGDFPIVMLVYQR